jgi:integrase
LTVEDGKRLLSAIRGERLEAFFVLALTTGLRCGELLALRWEDVDLNSRQLRVRQALQLANGKLRIVEPTASSSKGPCKIAMGLRPGRARRDSNPQPSDP